MKGYYRVILGKKHVHAAAGLAGGFIGVNDDGTGDISRHIPDELRAFNHHYAPLMRQHNPGWSKIATGLACGVLWRIARGMQPGDIVLCPDGSGNYRVGEITGGYHFIAAGPLPHRRKVNWLDMLVPRAAMSEALQNSTGSIGTISTISDHRAEIERFLAVAPVPLTIIGSDATIEDPAAFAMEAHLEAFLVGNWDQTELAKSFAIYEENGERVGQQYETDAGPIDILAISKDRKRLLVVELKRGRANDVVVGQVLRYMGYVKSEIAEADQTVEGAIIALHDDQKLRWALAAVPNVSFYRYEIKFKLVKA
ncbi:endonuclease NucS domain-containing protein [Bosea sp. RAC05]|uniref:endonuclease NucS domain-containing protein n=1 Tax=Bosea sp. RAC05 TaxID=1842539 RepID=UPI00083D32D4|nr:endonuclease NucS domain-containing protein [Bosea sp. RAC05]AOG04641.1 hypothetical protein BSY19_2996 [Bosea sp. RAC05]